MAFGTNIGETPQADPGQLMDIGTVAAQNIALAINADPKAVPAIKQAIRDEISAMSSHFTLAFADIQTQYESELAKIKSGSDAVLADIKSTYSYLRANWATAGAAGLAVLIVGIAIGTRI